MKLLRDDIEPAPERDAEGHAWCSLDCPALRGKRGFTCAGLGGVRCLLTGEVVEPDPGLPPRSPCLAEIVRLAGRVARALEPIHILRGRGIGYADDVLDEVAEILEVDNA